MLVYLATFLIMYYLHILIIRYISHFTSSDFDVISPSNKYAADVSTFAKTVISLHGNLQSNRVLKNELDAFERLSGGLELKHCNKSRFISLPRALPLESGDLMSIHPTLEEKNAQVQEHPNDSDCVPASGTAIGSEMINICDNKNDGVKIIQDVKNVVDDEGAAPSLDTISSAKKSHPYISDFPETPPKSILSHLSTGNISKILDTEASPKSTFISEDGDNVEVKKVEMGGGSSDNISSSVPIVMIGLDLLNPATCVKSSSDITYDIGNEGTTSSPASTSTVIIQLGLFEKGKEEQEHEQYSLDVGNVDYNCSITSDSSSSSNSSSKNASPKKSSIDIENREGSSSSDVVPTQDSLNVMNSNVDDRSKRGGNVIDLTSEQCLLEKIRVLKKEEGALYFKLVKVSEKLKYGKIATERADRKESSRDSSFKFAI